MKEKSGLIIVGGFLGAGKTTALRALAEFYRSKGRIIGLITNDQATGLVDTQVLSMGGMEVQEVSGSCFCCDFNGLMDVALFLREAKQCDPIIAEPVGSCTDLSATILQPIKAKYHKYFKLAPLSVLVDPTQLLALLEKDDQQTVGSGYIYMKQIVSFET